MRDLDKTKKQLINELRALRGRLAEAEKRQAPQVLPDPSRFSAILLESAPVAVFVKSPDNRILFVNRTWERVVGRRREEVLGRPADEVLPPQTARQFDQRCRQVLDREEVVSVVESAALPAGVRRFHTLRFPLRDADGRVEAVAGIAVDVTGRPTDEPRGGGVARPVAPEQLTPRQWQVLRLIAGGRSGREIAEALHISVKTVESHRLGLMRRLGVRSVAGLVRYALQAGVVEE